MVELLDQGDLAMSHNSFNGTLEVNEQQRVININNVYDLSDLLEKLQVQIDLSPLVELDYGDARTNYNIYEISEIDGEISTDSILTNSFNSWSDYNYTNTDFDGALTFQGINRIIENLNQLSTSGTLTANNRYQIGLSLENLRYETTTGSEIRLENDSQDNWDPITSSQTQLPDDDQILINLEEGFFTSLEEANIDGGGPGGYEFYVSQQPTNGDVIDLGQIAQEDWDTQEFVESINERIGLSITSTAPSFNILKAYSYGSATFRHENSGEEIRLQLNDNDQSFWTTGITSSQGAIDSVFDDETGERIGTKVEFGVSSTDPWHLEEFIRDTQRAFDSDKQWVAEASTQTMIDQTSYEISQAQSNFDSPQRWDFVRLDLNNSNSFNENISGLSDEIAATNLHFYTKPINSSDDPSPPSLVQFEVDEFEEAYVNLATGDAGFDLFLSSPTYGEVNNYIEYDSTRGYLNYRPVSVTGVVDENIVLGSLEELSISFYNNLDGLKERSNAYSAFGEETLEFLSNEVVNQDEFSVTYELRRAQIDNYPFNDDAAHSSIEFERFEGQNEFFVQNSQGDYQNYYHINQIFPDYELVEQIQLTNQFDIESNISPFSYNLGFADDPSIGFTYELTTNDGIDALTQNAVLGDSVVNEDTYQLNLYAESLQRGYDIDSADITLKFNPDLFIDINAEDVTIGGAMPIGNAVHVDNENGFIRIAAASLSELGVGNGFAKGSGEDILATINLNFDESSISTLDKNADGSLKISPLAFDVSVNEQETTFSRSFIDSDGYENKEILTLDDLGGDFSIDGQDVTLYEAKINLEQQSDGLVLGSHRVIGTERGFTNLLRKGDTIETSVDWLNVGNIRAENLSYTSISNTNAELTNAYFTDYSIASGEFIDGEFDDRSRESTTLHTSIKITGNAGNVVDLSDGIVSINADGSDVFNNAGKGSSNLITFQGDLNYDGRVSMKDLAYLNAGAARQELIEITNQNGETVEVASDASYARDVDADFSGKIDLYDLSILDADWGKTLHTGDEQFQGSSEISWSELDEQGDNSSWDNDSFKDQNEIEAEDDYSGSLEAPGSNVYGADGNYNPYDDDITETFFQDT